MRGSDRLWLRQEPYPQIRTGRKAPDRPLAAKTPRPDRVPRYRANPYRRFSPPTGLDPKSSGVPKSVGCGLMRAGKPPQFLVMASVNRAPDRGCHRRLTPQILVLPAYRHRYAPRRLCLKPIASVLMTGPSLARLFRLSRLSGRVSPSELRRPSAYRTASSERSSPMAR